MPPPAMMAFDDGFAHQSNENEWQGFRVFPGENPNPNFNFLMKKAIMEGEKTIGPIFSRTSGAKEDSFRIVLPPAMPPPRDSAVPLPMLPEPMRARKKLSHQESILFMKKSRRYSEKIIYQEEDFKCNAFCLSLPGFGKQKPLRSASKRQDSMDKKIRRTSSLTNSTVSIRASLEKFECSSWGSTAALMHDNGRSFFDYPVEMMKSSSRSRDVQEPVTAGFLFERETETLTVRSALKTRSTRDHQRSGELSPRRVRFSPTSSASASCPTSPRTCITPRLRKAREDFNTFLAAQNA